MTPLILVPFGVLALIVARDVRRMRRWDAKRNEMLRQVDAINLARRHYEDAQVEFIEACWDLPPAQGSF